MSMVDLGQLHLIASSQGSIDRRMSNRFPVQQEIKYRLLQPRSEKRAGVGKTLDISSGGILFTTDQRLPVGRTIEIAMHWPARLNGTCPLQFVATGRVIRSDRTTAAVRIQKYEFRTRAAATMSAGTRA